MLGDLPEFDVPTRLLIINLIEVFSTVNILLESSVVRNCVSGSWSKQIVTPDKKWFTRSVQLEVLMDRSVGTTLAKYPSLCTHSCDEIHMVTGNTNRKTAEKLNENYSYHAQGCLLYTSDAADE